MNNSKLYDFLRALSDDPNKLTEFENDPEQAMTAAGLTEEEKDLIKSGDEQRIMRHLGGQNPSTFPFGLRIRNMRIRFGV